MLRLELPELENLYYSICLMDYYSDLSEKDLITNKIEEDAHFSMLKKIDDKLLNGVDKLEKIPIKFLNQEEYIKLFLSLFYIEIKAQLSRSKLIEVYSFIYYTYTNYHEGRLIINKLFFVILFF